ncbi:MAG: hypothetical protein ACYCVN_08980 [Acidimicrobiales bacterium]
MVTADAIHTQKKAARLVIGKKGHYIFGVKENQPKLWNADEEVECALCVRGVRELGLDVALAEVGERTVSGREPEEEPHG